MILAPLVGSDVDLEDSACRTFKVLMVENKSSTFLLKSSQSLLYECSSQAPEIIVLQIMEKYSLKLILFNINLQASFYETFIQSVLFIGMPYFLFSNHLLEPDHERVLHVPVPKPIL